jgi:hypothetical protein
MQRIARHSREKHRDADRRGEAAWRLQAGPECAGCGQDCAPQQHRNGGEFIGPADGEARHQRQNQPKNGRSMAEAAADHAKILKQRL